VARSGTTSPFHSTEPSKSMSSCTTSGSVVAGGALPEGRFRSTECSWIGIVMISITSSTSITSINGVVFMSPIPCGRFFFPPLPALAPMLMAIVVSSAARRRFGHERDLGDAGTLARKDDSPHGFVSARAVAPDVHLGLRHLHRLLLQAIEEHAHVGHVQ